MNSSQNIQFDSCQLIRYYEEEFDGLLRCGISRGLQLDQAKDLIQQLFLDFAEKRLNLDAIGNPRSYIHTSFRNRLIDFHRAAVKNKQLLSVAHIQPDEESIDQKIVNTEASTELTLKLKIAYDNLPARCRKVIFLKFYEGLNNEEIAEKTGLSLRSVYNNLSEAIRLLRVRIPQGNPVKSVVAVSFLLASILFNYFLKF